MGPLIFAKQKIRFATNQLKSSAAAIPAAEKNDLSRITYGFLFVNPE
jgi:hypothetical protein